MEGGWMMPQSTESLSVEREATGHGPTHSTAKGVGAYGIYTICKP